MKKLSILLFFAVNCALGQSSTLIEPNGINGIFSKNATTVLSNTGGFFPLPATGAGTRLMWIPAKSAFRVGTVDGDRWDSANLGSWSFASGFDTQAKGSTSTSLGQSTVASGPASTSMGSGTIASGDYSTSMGAGTTASGDYSTSMGATTTATGYAATSMGNFTTASGVYSTSMGNATTASGNNSVSMGFFTTAQARNSVALGYFNIVAGSETGNVATDPLLVAGNGVDLNNRNNALTLLKNSNLGLNTATPQYQLTFKDDVGDKISLWGGNTSNTDNHYGFGIQASLLQVFTPTNTTDVVIGYGRSAAFTENVRFKGNGLVGIGVSNPSEYLDVNGRMRLRHRPGFTSGIWLSNSANSTAVADGAFYGLKSDTEAGIWIGNNWRFWVSNTGNVTADGEINRPQTGDANLVPIAYGAVVNAPNGTLSVGSTSNLSMSKTATGVYTITIAGEAYNGNTHTCVVTSSGGTPFNFISTNSSSGKLIVYVGDTSGNLSDGLFHFVVYKK